MALIGSIVAFFKADSSDFEKHTKKAKKHANEFEEALHKAKHALELFGLALGAHEIVHGLMHAVEGTLQNSAALEKLSVSTGIGVTALSELQHAATASHIEFEELTAGIKKMTVNLGQAATGGAKEVQEGLEQIGLSARSLANEGGEKAFEDIINGLRGIENPLERAGAAAKIFGAKMALNIVPLVDGKQSMAELRQEARELGVSLSETQATALAAAHEATIRLNEAVRGLSQSFTISLAPVIEDIATRLTDETLAINNNTDAWDKNAKQATEAQRAYAGALNALQHTSQILLDVDQRFQRAGLYLKEAAQFVTLDGAYRNTAADIALLNEQMKLNNELFLNKDASEGKKFLTKLGEQAKHTKQEKEGTPQLKEQDLGPTKEEKKKQAQVEEFTAHLKEQVATFGMSAAEIDRYKIALMGLNPALRFELGSLTYELEAKEKAKKATEELAKEEKKHAEQQKQEAEERHHLLEEFMTPKQKYAEAVMDAADFLNDAELAKFDKAMKKKFFGHRELGSGAEFGTQEARDLILQHRFGKSEDFAERTAVAAEKTVDKTQKVVDKIEDFMRKTKREPDLVLDF